MDHYENPRRLPRYRVEISLTVISSTHDGEVHGICREISEGGVTAIISAELRIGEMVNLRFAIRPDSHESTLQAIVRWRERLQHGFEFWNVPEEGANKIKVLCEDLRNKTRVVETS